MNKYPEILRTRLDRNNAALLATHADARGITTGELAREILADGLRRLSHEPTTPVWLELFAIENFRLRAVVLRLIEELGEKLGWTREHLTSLLTSTRANADRYALERLAEIEKHRLAETRRPKR